MVKVKICGLTNKEDALSATALGAWALGFIFYKKSPRYVAPEMVAKIIKGLPKKIMTVGVFVNAGAKEIHDIVNQCQLKAVQFHGDETPSFCRQFKGVQTIKAIRIKNARDMKKAWRYKTDWLLLDAFQQGVRGGTGKTFDWTLLQAKKISLKKVILSGGLNPDNIRSALSAVKVPAVDACSGIERRPGKKCQRLMRKFFQQIKG